MSISALEYEIYLLGKIGVHWASAVTGSHCQIYPINNVVQGYSQALTKKQSQDSHQTTSEESKRKRKELRRTTKTPPPPKKELKIGIGHTCPFAFPLLKRRQLEDVFYQK